MQEVPPSGLGPLGKREERLAWGMLLPTILSVSLIIILPLCAIFWISFKPISLADLRPPTVLIKEQLKGQINAAGDAAKIRYRIRNSSQTKPLNDVTVSDVIPNSFDIHSTDDRCSVDENNQLEERDSKEREDLIQKILSYEGTASGKSMKPNMFFIFFNLFYCNLSIW